MTGLTIPFTGLKKQYSSIRNEILDVTDEVLRSGNLMSGNHSVEFEHWLARKNRQNYAVTCHSGTQALEIIAEYYFQFWQNAGYSEPKVVIPSLTYTATANAFIRAGWTVIFVDVDKYGVAASSTFPPITEYQAVVLIGLYGHGLRSHADVKNWRYWYNRNISIIEDGAQHWLADQSNRIGLATAISFDPMKNLPAYGNGGAVVTDDLDLTVFARNWRNNGKEKYNQEVGTNSRMSEIDCAQMMIKTKYLDAWQKRRAEIAAFWNEQFESAEIRSLIDRSNSQGHAYHKYVIEVDDRDELQKRLIDKKIETKIHYKNPLYEIGIFRQFSNPGPMSLATSLSRRVLSLPFYPELTDLEVEFIADQVSKLYLSRANSANQAQS
jgi:dTDP-4-amino-4,6-dideoxygalactose transaminase